LNRRFPGIRELSQNLVTKSRPWAFRKDVQGRFSRFQSISFEKPETKPHGGMHQ
jgi:hypothetical protein